MRWLVAQESFISIRLPSVPQQALAAMSSGEYKTAPMVECSESSLPTAQWIFPHVTCMSVQQTICCAVGSVNFYYFYVGVSLILASGALSLGNWFQVFWDDTVASSVRVEISGKNSSYMFQPLLSCTIRNLLPTDATPHLDCSAVKALIFTYWCF